jgi:hypothetical protein
MTRHYGKMIWASNSRWLKILLFQLLMPRGKTLENPQDKWKSLRKLLLQSGKSLKKDQYG